MNLTEIFNTYYDKIYSFTLMRVGNVHDAEDITSDVFVKVTDKLETYNPERAAFSTWIFTIAYNEIKMHYRSNKNIWAIESIPEIADRFVIDEELLQKEEKTLLFYEICKLDEKHKNAILLKYFGAMSYSQIAEFLGTSESNVGFILNSARTILKNALK